MSVPQLAALFSGGESLGYWVTRFPSIRARLLPVVSEIAADPLTYPRVDYSIESAVAAGLTKEAGTEVFQLWASKLPAGSFYAKFGKVSKYKQDAAEAETLLGELQKIDWRSNSELYKNGHADNVKSWPRYFLPPLLAGGKFSDPLIELDSELGDAYRLARESQSFDLRDQLKGAGQRPEVIAELERFGDAARLLSEADALWIAPYSAGSFQAERERFDLILEEAHLSALYGLLPLLYRAAWRFLPKFEGSGKGTDASEEFPGMPAGWLAAVTKAAEKSIDEDASKAWIYTVVEAREAHKAALVPMFDLTSALPPYRVMYRWRWWESNGWPKGYPDLATNVGTQGGAGLDIATPLIAFDLDTLEPDIGDLIAKVAAGLLLGVFAAGWASVIAAELGAAAGLSAEGIASASLEAGLEATIQTGLSAGTGADVDFGDLGTAFLGKAADSLLEDPVALLDGISDGLGGIWGAVAPIGEQVAGYAGQVDSWLDAIEGVGSGGSAYTPPFYPTDVLPKYPGGVTPENGEPVLAPQKPIAKAGVGAGLGTIALAALVLLLVSRS